MVCASVRKEDNPRALAYSLCVCTEDNPRALASGLSSLQTHKPYSNCFIAKACTCALCCVGFIIHWLMTTVNNVIPDQTDPLYLDLLYICIYSNYLSEYLGLVLVFLVRTRGTS